MKNPPSLTGREPIPAVSGEESWRAVAGRPTAGAGFWLAQLYPIPLVRVNQPVYSGLPADLEPRSLTRPAAPASLAA